MCAFLFANIFFLGNMSIAKTRQKLIEVARDLFAHNGLEAPTMNDIAQASGKGRRTLYTYFRNKEEIYKAVVEEELERLSERMELVAAQDAAPERKILTLIYAHLNAMRETVARNGSLRAEFFRNIWNVRISMQLSIIVRTGAVMKRQMWFLC